MSSPVEEKRNFVNSRRRAQVTESPSRAESEVGGVPLHQNESEPLATGTAPAPRRKRRPKKIANKAEEQTKETSDLHLTQKSTDVTLEVRALKSKVREIEAQVQEILLRPAAPTKSARRRARQQKGASSSAASAGYEAEEVVEEKSAETHEATTANLQRLQNELKDAQEELLILKGGKAGSESPHPAEEDDVEDIPRTHGPGLVDAQRPRPLGRAVTLSGSYRIPIPVNVSDSDFDAISKGISSAQNIARSFINSSAESRTVPDRSKQARPDASSSGSSWSEWIGGYTMSVAKAVDKVRITSNMETVPQRPALAGRSETAPPTRRKPQKLEMRSKKGPNLPEGRRKLSDTQVAGLLA